MNHCRPLAVSIALSALLLAVPARAAYHSLEEIPVESPIYRMVEELATTHGFGTAFLDTRPWDRVDLGRFLDELQRNSPRVETDPVYVRLRRELGPSEAPGGWDALARGDDDQSSLELSPYVRADYFEDRSRSAIVRDFRGGARGSLALGESVLLAGDVYAGTNSPGGHGNPTNSRHFALVQGVELNTYYDRATATMRGRLGRLAIGHTWLRWGPGAWGTMGLSDGAPAFDVIEARVPLLRRAQLEWFVATLDPAVESLSRRPPPGGASLGPLGRVVRRSSRGSTAWPTCRFTWCRWRRTATSRSACSSRATCLRIRSTRSARTT